LYEAPRSRREFIAGEEADDRHKDPSLDDAELDRRHEESSDYEDARNPLYDPLDDPPRPRREFTIDWVRFHGENCRDDSDMAIWRRLLGGCCDC
jgi:hypothetical protein